MNKSNKINNLCQISVIGHTNVGKTSLLRTLLRDTSFGEVQNASATTRHVSAVDILGKDNVPLVTLHDTPGLEDATGVMDFLQDYTDTRADGVERLQQFLQAVQACDERLGGDYRQEAKVINSLLSADIAIYVIDAKEPVLAKYKDELAILANSGTPILPVFNFTAIATQQLDAWREMLARRVLHISNAFDTVAFDFDSEMALWENLKILSNHNANIAKLQQERAETWQDLLEMGSGQIADFLINVAAFAQKIDSQADPAPILNRMQHAVRQAEQVLQQNLLTLYRFYHSDIHLSQMSITGATQDIFDKEILAHYGIRTAGGSGIGMLIGAGIDVATLGASLGLGTAIGGVLGGLLPNTHTIKDKAMGVQTLTIDAATITLLAARAQSLHHHLRHRGHASLAAITADSERLPWQSDNLPAPIKKARTHPNYCSLDDGDGNGSNLIDNPDNKAILRADLADKLAEILILHQQNL
ncbi:GTPase/DUF3482 domain-containing protein [Moraxella marmotae]|uniref:GTPase/DUF3482 domain-containing protein n=1 Tax=Moraxella marmotae TaxID=3344520 RepID=UPI0035F4DED1